MALRAGYVGVKRRLYEALTKESAENAQSITDIRNDNDVLGAKNLFKSVASNNTVHLVAFAVNSDGTITANGTADADAYFIAFPRTSGDPLKGLSKGVEYILSGDNATDGKTYVFINYYTDSTRIGGTNTSGSAAVNGEIKFTIPAAANYIDFGVAVLNGKTVSDKVFSPMIRLATDPNNTYVPYAMTNQQLTASADDQKTTINAIISAATGAADFAAFKTAMAAITPVTRSAAPDERSLEVEEPVVVKKSTRKSTKKTEEEE